MTVTNDVRVEIYRGFIEGCKALQPKEVAANLGLEIDQVQGGLRELAEKDVIAFHPGTEELWLAHPFCATEAPFNVSSTDRRWHAICIWDALGILALIEADGKVSTRCPDCKEPIVLEVKGGEVHGPSETIVHFGVPAREWYADVGYT